MWLIGLGRAHICVDFVRSNKGSRPVGGQDFSSKNFHYKTNIEGMWWHDDVSNHYIRNCLTISSMMMEVWNSHGKWGVPKHYLKWEVVPDQPVQVEKPRLINFFHVTFPFFRVIATHCALPLSHFCRFNPEHNGLWEAKLRKRSHLRHRSRF